MKPLPRFARRAAQWLPALFFLSGALAGPVEVGYKVSGGPKKWTLDFWVKNKLGPADMRIFVVGLELPAGSVIVAPEGFGIDRYDHYFHGGAGGTSTQYNRAWAAGAAQFLPSHTVSGFLVHLEQAEPPKSVPWFVLARSDSRAEYRGEGHFGTRLHPGFEGLAVASVSEPGTYGLLGGGLAGIALLGQYRRRRAVSADAG